MSQPKEFQSNMRFGSSKICATWHCPKWKCLVSSAKASQHNGGLSFSIDKVGAKSGDTLRVRRRGPSMPTAGKCGHGRAPTTYDSLVAVSLCCVKHGHEKRVGHKGFHKPEVSPTKRFLEKHVLTLTLLYQQPPRPNNNFETRTWMDTCPACYP